MSLLSRVEAPTGTKNPPFYPGWWLQPGQKVHVPVRATNRDKRGSFCPGWCLQPGQKASVPSAGPASRWTRDKSHLLSRTQRLPGQMTWNKGLFCSSGLTRHMYVWGLQNKREIDDLFEQFETSNSKPSLKYFLDFPTTYYTAPTLIFYKRTRSNKYLCQDSAKERN